MLTHNNHRTIMGKKDALQTQVERENAFSLTADVALWYSY